MIETYPAGTAQNHIRKVRPATLPTRPKVRVNGGEWVEASEYGWMVLLGEPKDFARRGIHPSARLMQPSPFKLN